MQLLSLKYEDIPPPFQTSSKGRKRDALPKDLLDINRLRNHRTYIVQRQETCRVQFCTLPELSRILSIAESSELFQGVAALLHWISILIVLIKQWLLCVLPFSLNSPLL